MRSPLTVVPRRARIRWLGPVVAVVLGIATAALAPAMAAAQACPSVDESYTGNCGPTFAVPNWTDAGGWSDPSQYATIQLADVNGDKRDELIGRNVDGVEIFWFDTSVGQWRPQTDANGVRQLLTSTDASGGVVSDFASPPQSDESDPHSPALAAYYTTIQAADIDGQPGEEILARFWDGMRVYKYTPPAGGNNVDGGTWNRIGSGGPFSDAQGWGDPSLYLTIKTADVDGDNKAELVSRTTTGAAIYTWTGSDWAPDGSQLTYGLFGGWCNDPPCFGNFRPFEMPGGSDQLLALPGGAAPANRQGAQLVKRSGKTAEWSQAFPPPQSPQDPAAAPFNSQPGWPDCPSDGSIECLPSSPVYFESMRAADIDGAPGDELLGLLEDGLRLKQLREANPQTTDDADASLDYIGTWIHATNVPGALNGTLSSSTDRAVVIWQGGVTDTIVRVIGPKGPGLGTLTVQASAEGVKQEEVTVDLNAATELDQQVLFEYSAPSGSPRLLLNAEENREPGIALDAILHGSQLDSKWTSLATLSDLAGDPFGMALNPGYWGSIRTANIDGTGGDEVLALDGTGLGAWSYNPASNAWSKLQPSTPLALGADPGVTHPEYYSTIRTGDVDGDGRDDVVARGPFGVRTWFYDRRGTGGWERYLPAGYSAFPVAPCPQGVTGPCGQAGAYAVLTTLGKNANVLPKTVTEARGLWASEDPPSDDQLNYFQSNLAGLVGCTGPSTGEPRQYQTCTPPAGTTQFSADELTVVVNQLLAESFWAENVVDHFTDLQTILDNSLPENATALNAIGEKLSLQAAAGSTTPSQFSGGQLWSVITGIAGAIAGLADPVVGAGLAISSYVFSTLPSASPTAMSTFPSTYSGLATTFATMVAEMQKAHDTQSQDVRQDAGLLTLVGQLRSSGTWQLDTVGMESAANQGFATWAYRTLMPTLYQEYDISQCTNHVISDVDVEQDVVCPGGTPPSGPGVLGGGARFITIAAPFAYQVTPCGPFVLVNLGEETQTCTFNLPPSDLMNGIWGAVSPGCAYTPGQSNTKWTFGNCSAGVDANTSIGANTWGFTYHQGNPAPQGANGATGATAARASRRTPVVLGRPRLGRRRAVRGRARFVADVTLPGLRLAGATLRLDRRLFERRGREELLRPNGPRVPRRLTLRRTGSGHYTATRAKDRRRLRVTVDRRASGRARLTLTASAPKFRTPGACHALPARFGLRHPKPRLESRLFINDGNHRLRVVLHHQLRCARDRLGNVNRLVTVRPHRYPQRRGLAVTVRGPRRVQPGSTVKYRVRVHNRRRGKSRLTSSLWDIMLHSGPRTKRIHELRRGRTRTVILTRQVPRTARGRYCAHVVASAPGTRAASDRLCTPVHAAARARTG